MLSFKTFLTETETLKLGSFINDQGQHDVGTIVNLLKKNKVPVRNVPISRLLRKNSDIGDMDCIGDITVTGIYQSNY